MTFNNTAQNKTQAINEQIESAKLGKGDKTRIFNSTIQNKIQAINEQIESEKLDKVVKLSRLNLWAAIIFSAILPISGYIYTRRWLSFFGLMLGGVVISMAVHAVEPKQKQANSMAEVFCMLYGSIVAPIDNARAIARARERISDLSQ